MIMALHLQTLLLLLLLVLCLAGTAMARRHMREIQIERELSILQEQTKQFKTDKCRAPPCHKVTASGRPQVYWGSAEVCPISLPLSFPSISSSSLSPEVLGN